MNALEPESLNEVLKMIKEGHFYDDISESEFGLIIKKLIIQYQKIINNLLVEKIVSNQEFMNLQDQLIKVLTEKI